MKFQINLTGTRYLWHNLFHACSKIEEMKKDTASIDNSKKRKKRTSLGAASLGRSATAQARRHSADDAGLASTGTNISYEGATAPGSGGSVGTGYASGQEATGAKIATNSDFVQNRGGSPSKTKMNKEKEADQNETDKDLDEDEDFDEQEELDEDEDLDEDTDAE